MSTNADRLFRADVTSRQGDEPLSPARGDIATYEKIARESARKRAKGIVPDSFNAPIGCQLELTSACNLECIFCYNRSVGRQPGDLLPEDWLRIAGELADLGLFQCVISGGEPLLLGDTVFDIMDILHEQGAHFLFISNGWLLTEGIAERLSKYRFLYIQISIDGAYPELHDAVRGREGSWERAVRAAHYVHQAGIPLTIAHTIIGRTVDTVGDMVDLAYALGAEQIIGDRFGFSGVAYDNAESIEVTPEQEKQLDEAIETKRCFYEGRMVVARVMTATQSLITSSAEATSVALIRPNGDVKIDCTAPFVIGNVKHQSVAEIWESVGSGAWQHPVVSDYIERVRQAKGADHVTPRPYLDPDLRLEPVESAE